MNAKQFGAQVQESISALMAEGERRSLDELGVPPPNKAERDAAAKYERKNSATPTPWQQHSDHLPFQIIGDMDGPDDGHFHYISVASTDSDDANPAGVDAANARLIVRCVNSHGELLEIAKQIALVTEGCDDAAAGTHYVAKDGVIRCKGSFLDLIERARKALAKAREA